MLRATLISLVAALTASLSILILSTTASAANRSPAQTTGQFFLKNTTSPRATTRVVGAMLVCHEGTCKWFKVKVMDLD
jgi:hypothetical protein